MKYKILIPLILISIGFLAYFVWYKPTGVLPTENKGSFYQNDKDGYSFYLPEGYQIDIRENATFIYNPEHRNAFEKLKQDNMGKWIDFGNIDIYFAEVDSLPENITNSATWLEKIKISNFEVYTGEDLPPMGLDKVYYVKLNSGYLLFQIRPYIPNDPEIGKFNQEYNQVILKIIETLKLK